MGKMADKMFGNSPKMERDEESSKMVVKKKAMDKDKTGEAEDQGSGEQIPMESRHAMDRLSMHHKHEGEHMSHKGGDKKEMHKRHMEEHEAMMKRHDKEMGKKE